MLISGKLDAVDGELVVNHLTALAQHQRAVDELAGITTSRGQALADAINTATQQWMGWTIGRQTSKDYGIPRGMPYLTGFVIHTEIVEDSLAA